MAIEAASVAADEAPPTATDPSLSDPPQLSKSDSAQKAIKEPVKPQIPIASLDANKGTGILLLKQDSIPFSSCTMWIHDAAHSYLGAALHLVNLFSCTFKNTVRIVIF